VRRLVATSRPTDWLIVASLLLLAWFEIWVEPLFQTGMPGPRVPLTLLSALALVPLLARRAFPLAVLTAMCVGSLAVGIVGDSDQSSFVLLLGLLIGTYSLAAHATPLNALVGAAVVAASAVVLSSVTFEQQTLIDAVVPVLFLGAAWVVGKEVHRQRQRAREMAEHSALIARTHGLEVQAAVAAERARIARELHDVVAHAISVMGIQASAARRTLASGQEPQEAALLDVERLGREALEEMHRLLGVLRADDDGEGTHPLPDLTQLSGLVADARTAGLAVDVDEEPAGLHVLPPGVQLTAYRIVQEALTNVRKHAPGSTVSITLRRRSAGLEVAIADDGVGAVSEPNTGNGLIGMRERVAMHRGTLYAGPGEERGFMVRAWLPVTEAV
jgi:signal transduction histidine kinase